MSSSTGGLQGLRGGSDPYQRRTNGDNRRLRGRRQPHRYSDRRPTRSHVPLMSGWPGQCRSRPPREGRWRQSVPILRAARRAAALNPPARGSQQPRRHASPARQRQPPSSCAGVCCLPRGRCVRIKMKRTSVRPSWPWRCPLGSGVATRAPRGRRRARVSRGRVVPRNARAVAGRGEGIARDAKCAKRSSRLLLPRGSAAGSRRACGGARGAGAARPAARRLRRGRVCVAAGALRPAR